MAIEFDGCIVLIITLKLLLINLLYIWFPPPPQPGHLSLPPKDFAQATALDGVVSGAPSYFQLTL